MESDKSLYKGILGVIREKKNKWERRVAVTPTEVKYLVENGIKVIIQPMSNRWFTHKEFEQAGAIFQDDISEADLIVGVKEVPIDELIEGKKYMFFSHTIKAQPYNMPLLDKILEKKINLVDYECIRQDGNRLVAFGRFAGIAGACDFMRGIGEFLLEKNLQTFFLNVCSSFMYLDLDDMIEGIKKVGKNIETKGLPEELAPYVFAVTATGRTAQGALELLEYLPHEYVTADQLADLPADNSKVYICNLTAKDLYEPIDPEKQFNKEEYYDEPEKYKSKFHTYYDKITFLINWVYYEEKYPKLIYESELCEQKNMKFLGYTDISADYKGSIEITTEFSDIADPYNLYCPRTKKLKSKLSEYEDGDILSHCVDHLPWEIPVDASRHFGEKLCPFLIDFITCDMTVPFKELTGVSDVIKNALITYNGKLTKNYRYIDELRALREKQKKEDELIASLKRKKKGLKRAISFSSLMLKGHLFDSHFFNDCLNMLESADANFRIINIRCGQREEEKSVATLQIFTQDHKKLDAALLEIFDMAEKLDIKVIKNYEDEIDGEPEQE